MDACSSWEGNKVESGDQYTSKDQLRDCRAPYTRKTLPYQSLLSELRTLRMKHGEFFIWMGAATEHQIWTLELELRFQQMVFVFLKNFIFSDHENWFEALTCIQAIAEMEAKPVQEAAAGLINDHGAEAHWFYFKQWNSGVSKFLETIDQMIKPDLKEFCLGIVDRLLQGNFSREYDVSEFIDAILLKLKDLKISRPNMIVPVKKQIETLEEILHFVSIFIGGERNLENLQNFLVYFRPWVNFAAALVILYWLDLKDEELLVLVSPLLEEFNLSILGLVEAYMAVIKLLKPCNIPQIFTMRETVGRFTKVVLENLIVSTDDHFEMLRERLMLWIALFMDPPQANAEDEKSICTQTNLLIDRAESLIRLLCLDKLGEDITKGRNILLNDFLQKMNEAKEKVTQLHVEIPGLSSKNVPQTNKRGFFDFLLGNLQKKLKFEANMFPFEKHLIAIVHQELSFLRPFLMDIFELQDEHKELNDIWVQASNVAYLVDFVTDSCLSLIDVPIWSNLIHLSNAIEKIQFVKTKVFMFRKNDQVYKNRVISAKVNSKLFLPKRRQTNATTKDDVKVGFVDEEQRIIDRLIAGEVRLDIVGIVGMPGQGKTTLAQRVFQNSRVELHFNKYAWCCISQTYDIKDILLDILKDAGKPVSHEQIPFVSYDDVANRLRKCLKGQRYLVVLDDMWDVKVWYELQLSFPDDNNGSRILLTSRYHNVPLEAKPHCCIVELYPLSFEESWNLLRIKVFEEDCCPPTLSDIGKMIAKNCNGLPLSIVVVAGLLKKDKNVDSWKQISGSLTSHIAREGCMNLLDLSYTHLPDYLKPCFLYLGTFQEDQIINAKQLIQLWIVEGFIQNNGMKSKEVVANEYLMDLVSRSLVFIAQRSSRYGVKRCHVHDLLRELCLIKAKEEKFLMVQNVSDHSSSLRCDHYRLCVHGKWEPFADPKPIVPSVRSLLVSGGGLYYFSSAPSFLERFKLLKVLDLGPIFLSQIDFDEIAQLILLEFLSITCDFPIPSSIMKLFRLEVLRLRSFAKPILLPIALMKMANLRHIFSRHCFIARTEDSHKVKPELCPPLTNLETFTMIIFEQDDELLFERVAANLPNILKLGLILPFWICLSRYFPKLESLKLYISRSPKLNLCPSCGLDFPLTLKKLNLSTMLHLSCTMVSSIGKLSNLEVLKLQGHFEDERWNVEDDEFLMLKYLGLRNSSIQEWNVSEESFPFLEQLVVNYCHKLGELPGRFGAINTLKRIEVRHCSDSVSNSFQHIVDDQMDSGNEGLQFSVS